MQQGQSGLLVVERLADVRIILFADNSILDQANIERIKDELLRMVAAQPSPKFIITFEGVAHISSAVLGMLMAVNKAIAAAKGEMRLAAIDKSLMQVFKLTRLDKVLKIYATTEKALKKF